MGEWSDEMGWKKNLKNFMQRKEKPPGRRA
jgi:hypothetical protein